MTTLEGLAERVARGAALEADDAAIIAGTHDLIAVGMLADDVRRQMHGAETTFLRVFEVHVGAVPAALPPGLAAGEIRVVGRPESVDSACAAVAAVRGLAGSIPVSGFSLADLADLADGEPDLFARLAAAGLAAISEVPVDRLPAATALVQVARSAGLRVERITVDEPANDPVALVQAAVELQRRAGGMRVFAPLPRAVPVTTPTTGYDDVKLVALARLCAREISSIQVDWALYGPKLAQVALTMGADDVDGVAAVETGDLGRRRAALEEIQRNIRAAGLQPIERTGAFDRVAPS